jgi:quinoprotein glucose dehydrogenase
MTRPRTAAPDRGFGYWWPVALGLVILLIGLALAAGGGWLIALGGSWYYLLAGLGLILAGGLMTAHRRSGALVYAVVWLLTLVWAFWEVGLDGWALVPRVVAPTVLLLLVLLSVPALRRPLIPTAAAVLALALALAGPAMLDPAGAQQPDAPAPEAPTPPAEDGLTPAAAPSTPTPEAPTPAEPLEAGSDWPAYGGTYHGLRYSPLAEITRDNVAGLEEVWTFHTGDMPEGDGQEAPQYSPENTPLKVGDRLYTCTGMGIAIALDARTGREDWRYDPGVSPDAIPYGATCRGVAYYAVPGAGDAALCTTRILYGTLDARLIALDAETGQLCPEFGRAGIVDLNEGIGYTVPGWYAVTSPPTIVRGIAVMGAQVNDGEAEDAPSGVVRGYDAVTGRLAWAWDMGAPERTGAPPEGEVYTRGTPNMWTIAAGDEALGLVYLPLGNSAVDYWGGNRSDIENEYATSLVAIDVTTGQPAWHFQTVHYDVWDYDLGSQVSLVDLPTENGTVPALILPSKQGQIYVLNRATGEPLFPVEEREVPQNGVEPERLSPTQPYSAYARVDKPDIVERDMWGMSPLDQLWCRIQFHRAEYFGQYTAPTADRRWIQYPGYNGGSDWGSVAVDPERGILVVNYNDMPNYNQLIPREEAEELGVAPIYEGGTPPSVDADPQTGSPFAISINAGWRVPLTGLLCKQPPYGWIRGIDSPPARRSGTSRSAAPSATARSASRRCCRSPSARRTTAARWSRPAASPSSPRPPT